MPNIELPPPAWGTSPLANIFDLMNKNKWATFQIFPQQYDRLCRLHLIFEKIPRNISDPDPLTPVLLFMRSHSSFLGACRMAVSAQVLETFPLARTCLEGVLYGHHMYAQPDSVAIWAGRLNNDEGSKKCRYEFTTKNIFASLKSNNPQLAAQAEKLYDKCIDFGAHPNIAGVIAAHKLESSGGGEHKITQVFTTTDPALIKGTMDLLCSVGITALRIFQLNWQEKFDGCGASSEVSQLAIELGY